MGRLHSPRDVSMSHEIMSHARMSAVASQSTAAVGRPGQLSSEHAVHSVHVAPCHSSGESQLQ